METDDRTFLSSLVEALHESAVAGGGNSLLHLRESAGGVDIGFLPLGTQRPADALLGFVAPDDWAGLGHVGRGRPISLDTGKRRGLPASASVTVLVHRRHGVMGRMKLGDEVTAEPPAYGLVRDGLQRALGLPTAAPLVATGARFSSGCLELVVGAARSAVGPLAWDDVIGLHPAWTILDGDVADSTDLVAAAVALERACDWERLRWLVVTGSWQEPAVTPSDAAWFDAGAFSRWVMTFTPPPQVVLGDVRRVAGAHVARRCRAVLQRLGLLGGTVGFAA